MNERTPQWCVFLPCSENEIWAVPQNCLGEIVTIPNAQELPPEHITWRGHSLPVLDLNVDSASPWREPHGGAGKIAVILGLQGLGCDYWGVALRGDGLAMNPLVDEQVEEEANVDEVLQQLELAQESKGALFMLDKDMGVRTFTPPSAEGGA
jgi:hypothetical protein